METELCRLYKDFRPVSGDGDSLRANVEERDLSTI
jgi:hypothetical protein